MIIAHRSSGGRSSRSSANPSRGVCIWSVTGQWTFRQVRK
ncbi:hypothetical protein BN903_110 [Halorubrum sp. AJ67]|nr:hypothetical protein BN903_110 [Halorubrum sp. AJ67]